MIRARARCAHAGGQHAHTNSAFTSARPIARHPHSIVGFRYINRSADSAARARLRTHVWLRADSTARTCGCVQRHDRRHACGMHACNHLFIAATTGCMLVVSPGLTTCINAARVIRGMGSTAAGNLVQTWAVVSTSQQEGQSGGRRHPPLLCHRTANTVHVLSGRHHLSMQQSQASTRKSINHATPPPLRVHRVAQGPPAHTHTRTHPASGHHSCTRRPDPSSLHVAGCCQQLAAPCV
jgi:hypothetical protein